MGSNIPIQPQLAVDTPEAKEMIASDNAELVCVRSWPEYIGEVSGYNYIEAKGRIPGAVFADCGSDAYHMENYRNLTIPPASFRKLLKSGPIMESHPINIWPFIVAQDGGEVKPGLTPG